jgi:hypothetical protein
MTLEERSWPILRYLLSIFLKVSEQQARGVETAAATSGVSSCTHTHTQAVFDFPDPPIFKPERNPRHVAAANSVMMGLL